jgi:hypothetical protein
MIIFALNLKFVIYLVIPKLVGENLIILCFTSAQNHKNSDYEQLTY